MLWLKKMVIRGRGMKLTEPMEKAKMKKSESLAAGRASKAIIVSNLHRTLKKRHFLRALDSQLRGPWFPWPRYPTAGWKGAGRNISLNSYWMPDGRGEGAGRNIFLNPKGCGTEGGEKKYISESLLDVGRKGAGRNISLNPHWTPDGRGLGKIYFWILTGCGTEKGWGEMYLWIHNGVLMLLLLFVFVFTLTVHIPRNLR